MTLLTQQREAISKLEHLKVGALFMRPGTGKTRPTLHLIDTVPAVDYVLWLGPYQTIHRKDGKGIKDEIAKWGYSGPLIRFCGIETLSSSDKTYLDIHSELKKARHPLIVVDESLKIKNWEAKRTTRIIALGSLAEYKLILNGTPLSRNLLDIWAQFEFLSPKILSMGIAEFKNTFCEWVKITKRHNGRTHTREFIKDYHNVDHLYSKISPYVYEADLNLEIGKNWIEKKYKLTDEDLDTYYELKERYLDDEVLMAMNNNIFLEMTQKMQHGYCCTPDKMDVLDDIMKLHDEDSVIIFCKYIASREACRQKYPKAAVLSIQSESMGLNYQSRYVTVFFDKTWDYATLDQALHRTYRTGQEEDCLYYKLTGNVGLENLIDANIMRKENLLSYFKSHSMEQIRAAL